MYNFAFQRFRLHRCGLARLFAALATLVLAALAPLVAPAAEEDQGPLKIAFTSSMFADVNENDARASLRIWADTITSQRGLNAEPEVVIFSSTDAMAASLLAHETDAVALPAYEFAHLLPRVEFDHMYRLSEYGTAEDTRYILLVNTPPGSPEPTLADFAGRELLILDNANSSLALPWLDRELTTAGLPPATEHFGRLTRKSKLSQAVLPVFFGQVSASLVTAQGFATMSELNPQIGKRLHPIATSQPYPNRIFAFRKGYESPELDGIIETIADLQNTSKGAQILMIFQTEAVLPLAREELDPTLELLGLTTP
ncbi:PhnD/SsuA/transferrin family substrate-binding protein [Actomonas aquatica]|uniref:PhnD/SsuA/transferrin family substrate-binding protein n=1 Tax=Actomonas aquatica TaxID=2866162 RepID=A0ABZ1C4P8_9BACT|nr:PhnD/SsuA/transferrin family substrate-binding protein [Opitutus sp. WL0086]WRQ86330.1 PhnD/SsuA/transferrin family substrate-binding protein [Opitutus sp. WL0086]